MAFFIAIAPLGNKIAATLLFSLFLLAGLRPWPFLLPSLRSAIKKQRVRVSNTRTRFRIVSMQTSAAILHHRTASECRLVYREPLLRRFKFVYVKIIPSAKPVQQASGSRTVPRCGGRADVPRHKR